MVGVGSLACIMFLKNSSIKFTKQEILLKTLMSSFSSEMGGSSITHVLTWCQWLEGVITRSHSQGHTLQFTSVPTAPYCQPSPPIITQVVLVASGFHLELVPKLPCACPSTSSTPTPPPLLITPSAFSLSLLLIPPRSFILWLYNQNAWNTASLPGNTHWAMRWEARYHHFIRLSLPLLFSRILTLKSCSLI